MLENVDISVDLAKCITLSYNLIFAIWFSDNYFTDKWIKIPSKEERENPRIYNGHDPNELRNFLPNLPFFSLMSNHMTMLGGDSMTTYEGKEYYFGATKPGTSIRDPLSHQDNPTGASKCWKVCLM